MTKPATHKVAGFYELGPNVDRLVICTRNQLNHSDLFDTVRHEAIHVVQACYGGPAARPVERYIEDTSQQSKAVCRLSRGSQTYQYRTSGMHRLPKCSMKMTLLNSLTNLF